MRPGEVCIMRGCDIDMTGRLDSLPESHKKGRDSNVVTSSTPPQFGNSLRREFGVELARIILGHSTAFTTEVYAEVDRQQSMAVIAHVG
jgi:hypothetical protein